MEEFNMSSLNRSFASLIQTSEEYQDQEQLAGLFLMVSWIMKKDSLKEAAT